VGSTSRDQIVSGEAATSSSLVKWIGERLGVMSSGQFIDSNTSISQRWTHALRCPSVQRPGDEEFFPSFNR
jgi:hypothetical protein